LKKFILRAFLVGLIVFIIRAFTKKKPARGNSKNQTIGSSKEIWG
jgi:hypothetical protein